MRTLFIQTAPDLEATRKFVVGLGGNGTEGHAISHNKSAERSEGGTWKTETGLLFIGPGGQRLDLPGPIPNSARCAVNDQPNNEGPVALLNRTSEARVETKPSSPELLEQERTGNYKEGGLEELLASRWPGK